MNVGPDRGVQCYPPRRERRGSPALEYQLIAGSGFRPDLSATVSVADMTALVARLGGACGVYAFDRDTGVLSFLLDTALQSSEGPRMAVGFLLAVPPATTGGGHGLTSRSGTARGQLRSPRRPR